MECPFDKVDGHQRDDDDPDERAERAKDVSVPRQQFDDWWEWLEWILPPARRNRQFDRNPGDVRGVPAPIPFPVPDEVPDIGPKREVQRPAAFRRLQPVFDSLTRERGLNWLPNLALQGRPALTGIAGLTALLIFRNFLQRGSSPSMLPQQGVSQLERQSASQLRRLSPGQPSGSARGRGGFKINAAERLRADIGVGLRNRKQRRKKRFSGGIPVQYQYGQLPYI